MLTLNPEDLPSQGGRYDRDAETGALTPIPAEPPVDSDPVEE